MSRLLSIPEAFSPASDLQQQLRLGFRARKLAAYKVRLETAWENIVTEYPWEEERDPPYTCQRTSSGENALVQRPPKRRMRKRVAESICNKTTVLYMANDTRAEAKTGQKGHLTTVGDAVFDQWFRLCNPPCIDFDFYFAKPIQISENGPSNVQEFIDLHKTICDTATQMMIDKGGIDWAKDCEGRRKRHAWRTAKNYKVLPLCRAVLAMFEPSTQSQESLAQPEHKLLLVRTGDEMDMSSPIDFAPLMEYALPEHCSGITSALTADSQQAKEILAVRVPVHVAVKFLHGLQKREESARPDLYEHLINFQDRYKNPPLTRRVYGALPYFPENEEDFLREVWRGDLYEDGGEWGEWIQRASKRCR